MWRIKVFQSLFAFLRGIDRLRAALSMKPSPEFRAGGRSRSTCGFLQGQILSCHEEDDGAGSERPFLTSSNVA